eukprot:scaffold8481_cov33-Attheya_sp.AAC.3
MYLSHPDHRSRMTAHMDLPTQGTDPNDTKGHRTLEWDSCFACLLLLHMCYTDHSQRLTWNHTSRWGQIQITSHIRISPHREWTQMTSIDIVKLKRVHLVGQCTCLIQSTDHG